MHMKNEGLFIESPVSAGKIIIKTLWTVDADKTYNVTIEKEHFKGYTLLRTLKGSGHVNLRNNQSFIPSGNSILLVRSNEIVNYHTENSS